MNISVKTFKQILNRLVTVSIPVAILTGCVTVDENAVYNHGTIYSFLDEYPNKRLPKNGNLSDADILLYSNSFAQLLRAKAENSRMAADSLTAFSQSLNLVTGASGTLAIAATDVALLSFSNTTIPVFQKLFRTKDNPVAFRQAYSKVMQYKAEFQTANLPLWSYRDPSTVLSQNGLILLTKTEAVVTELVAATNGELVSDDVQGTSNQEMLPPSENKFMSVGAPGRLQLQPLPEYQVARGVSNEEMKAAFVEAKAITAVGPLRIEVYDAVKRIEAEQGEKFLTQDQLKRILKAAGKTPPTTTDDPFRALQKEVDKIFKKTELQNMRSEADAIVGELKKAAAENAN